MKFNQKENGDCDLIFSDKEIKILNDRKKLTFTERGLRDFGNNLVKIVAEWNSRFNEDIKKKQTFSNEVDLK